jgi:Transposase DDE domain
MPLPAGLFARAYRCGRFKGEAAFGKDTLLKQTFYGFRVHMRVCWPGVIIRLSVAPTNAHELSVPPELLESTRGLFIGDRNYWSLALWKILSHTVAFLLNHRAGNPPLQLSQLLY